MAVLKEIAAGYASPAQRSILAGLSQAALIQESFFLVGGTALSVFYLGHRVSDDIDLFTSEPLALPVVTDIVLRPWAGEIVPIERTHSFVSVMLRDVKIDFAISGQRERGDLPTTDLGAGRRLAIDSLESLAGRKLAALIGRVEPKDFVDYYFIQKEFPALSTESVFMRAKAGDAAFDDPYAAAALLREGFRIVLRSAPSGAGQAAVGAGGSGSDDDRRRGGLIPFPRLTKPIDWREFEGVFDRLAGWLRAR
jgi:hypothetical protein